MILQMYDRSGKPCHTCIGTEFFQKTNDFAEEDAMDCRRRGETIVYLSISKDKKMIMITMIMCNGGRQSSIYLLHQLRLTRKARGGKEKAEEGIKV